MASTGIEVEGEGKSVIASKSTPLQINQAKLLEELKYKFNFKSKASFGFRLESMTKSVVNDISVDFQLHYGCFNTSKGTWVINNAYPSRWTTISF